MNRFLLSGVAALACHCTDDSAIAPSQAGQTGSGGATSPPPPSAAGASAAAHAGTGAGAAARSASGAAAVRAVLAGASAAGASAAAGAAAPGSGTSAAGTGAPIAGAGTAGAAGAMPPAAGSGGAPAVQCPATAIVPGRHDGKVTVGGHDRTWLAYVPASYTGKEPVPLIFDFHGYGQPVTSQLGASGFSELADEHGFVVIYPAGVGGSWHVHGCCGQAAQEMLDEVGAVREVLKKVSSEICVDPKRIYASGISQGGGMAHHVACLAADVFAAVAPVSSDLRTDPCMPSRPVSEISFRGTADALSAYEGGPVGPPGMQYQSIGAKATLERWRTIDQCTGTPETTNELCETYKQCAGGTEVSLCTIPGGGHALYTNPRNFNLAKVAWEMFERQKLP